MWRGLGKGPLGGVAADESEILDSDEQDQLIAELVEANAHAARQFAAAMFAIGIVMSLLFAYMGLYQHFYPWHLTANAMLYGHAAHTTVVVFNLVSAAAFLGAALYAQRWWLTPDVKKWSLRASVAASTASLIAFGPAVWSSYAQHSLYLAWHPLGPGAFAAVVSLLAADRQTIEAEIEALRALKYDYKGA